VSLVAAAALHAGTAIAQAQGQPPNLATVPLGHKDFRPTPQRPVGWRGDRTGCYDGADPVTAWHVEKGINILWRVPLRQFSCSTPVVVGGKVFTTVEPRTLVCMDKMTGEILWMNDGGDDQPVRDPAKLAEIVGAAAPASQPASATSQSTAAAAAAVPWSRRKFAYGQFSGSSMPTPVSDGRRIWVKNGASAACFDLEGYRTWAVSTHLQGTDHPMNVPSPVLIGNVLLCEGGTTAYWEQNSKNKVPPGTIPPNPNQKFKHWMVGLNAQTGEILWDIGPLNAGGYGGAASPMGLTLTHGSEKMDVILGSEGHLIRAEDGKLLNPFVGVRCTFGSPFPLGQRVLFPHERRLCLLELTMQSRDSVEPKVLWTAPGSPKTMGGAVHHDGLLYVHSLEEPSWSSTWATVHDASDGRQVFRQMLATKVPKDTPDYPTSASAGKYVFLFSGRTASVLEPGRKPLLLAVSEFEKMHASPVFDAERLYLRTYDAMMCIARKGEEGARYEKDVQARTLLSNFPTSLKKRTLQEVAAPKDSKPGAGVPVVKLDKDKMPEQWLFAGPFEIGAGKDALESLGGCAAAQPSRGTKVAFGGTTCAFAAADRQVASAAGLDLLAATQRKRGVQAFFYTVVELAAPRTLVCDIDKDGVQAWLAGQPFGPERALALAAGRYPLMVKATIDADCELPAELTVKVVLRESESPQAEQGKALAFIRENAAVLKRVMELAPGSPCAARAAELLREARQ
jgi:outer membrane protein assembly factor BamB